MITGYLKEYKASVMVIDTETLLGIINYWVVCEDGPFTGALVYINSRELRRKQ